MKQKFQLVFDIQDLQKLIPEQDRKLAVIESVIGSSSFNKQTGGMTPDITLTYSITDAPLTS